MVENAVVVLLVDLEGITAATLHDIPADNVAAASDGELWNPEVDPGPVHTDDDVAGDNVVLSLLDRYATHVPGGRGFER